MNTKIIAKNSFWTATEFVLDFVAGTATSIAIARTLGPSQLGYYVYISWIASMSMILGNVGIPGAAVKYMAEHLANDETRGVARSIFDTALRIQSGIAVLISGLGIALVFLFGDPAYRLPSVLLMLTIIPGMINTMPTNANIASENLRDNLPGSICSAFLYSAGIVLSLVFGWRFTGIAASFLIARTTECVVRMVLVNRWMSKISPQPWPADLRRKLATFSGQNLILMVLGMVVWDRSEIFFLKNFYPDVRHVAYYSLAFSTAENVLKVIRIFSASASMTIRAQYGRDKRHLPKMLSLTAKYIALIAFPMYLGLAAAGPAALRLAYGTAYLPAIPVLGVAALLAIPKAFLVPVQIFLQATERQGLLLRWSLIGGAVNLLLDSVLIRHFGAMGAAYGNGLGQLFTVAALWIAALRVFPVVLPYRSCARYLGAAATMAAAVWGIARVLPPVGVLAVGIPAGAVVYLLALRAVKGVDGEDRERIEVIGSRLPARGRRLFEAGLDLISTRPARRAATGL